MRLQRRFYPLVTFLVLIALFIGLAAVVWIPKISHAVQPNTDNGLIGWPFSPSNTTWTISQGYDASSSPDHNCNSTQCYERYGFDFVPSDGTTAAGRPVYAPATGPIVQGSWPAATYYNHPTGECLVISMGSSMYVMTCHIAYTNGTRPTYVHKGDPVGTVYPQNNFTNLPDNSHIHMNIFSSSTPVSITQRTAIPFADPWMIQGCNYPLAPGETTASNYYYSPNGFHSTETVPCNNQGSSPNLTIHWGDNSFTNNGINLSRPVLVEVRNTFNNTDLFSQKVTTDSSGTATLTLTGIIPGYYTVMLKPDGFLRQSTNITLQAGANSVSFPMTVSGTDCNSGQTTTPQVWLGDVNGDNVINTADYNIILAYFGQTIPSQYADLDGDPSHTYSGVDYNIWLRSICFFGGGKGFVVGAGGAIDSISPSALHNTSVLSHTPPIAKTTPHKPNAPVLKQTPVATPRPEHAPAQHTPTKQVVSPTKQTLHPLSGSGTLTLSPATGIYRVGQSFTVTVLGDSGGFALNGTDMVLHYDPLVLSVASITPGTIFPSTPVHANDPSIGEIHISSNATSQPIIVAGALATIQFTVIGSGQTNVTFDYNPSSNARSDMAQSGNTGQVLGSVSNATYTVGILHVPQDYATISAALSAANAAETVLVAPGTYHEQFYVPSGVILQGQNRDTTIIDGDAVANRAVIYLGNGSTISGFTVQDSGPDFYDAAVWADQGPVTITNMRLMHNSMGIVRYCFTTPCPGNSTISNNIVIHNTYTGILVHALEALVQNNTVIDNQLQGITFEASGSQGTAIGNIIAYNMRGLSVTSATTLVNNRLWQNNPDYDPATTPGLSDLVADPLFLNASTSDYRLHAVSPAIQEGVALGAYPFIATGISPTNLSINQSQSGVTISWQTNGQAAGYTVSYAQGSTPFFSQTVDAGNTNSYTFPFPPFSGPVTFAVSSYDGQHNESFAGYVQATIASVALNNTGGSYNQTITATGSGFGNGELLNIYLDNSGNFPLASTSTDATGNFSTSFTIPQAVGGTHAIVAQGFTSGIVSTTSLYIYSAATLQYTQGIQGSKNTITGYGFAANEGILAYWSTGNTSKLLGSSTANSLGTATIPFTTLNKQAGTYSLYLVGQTSGSYAFTSFKIIPGLSITPTSGAHGSTATITGTGYRANEMVTVKWNCTSAKCGSTITLVTVKANGNGDFTVSVQIPTGASIGTYTIGGIGQTSKKFASTIYKVTS